MMALTSTGPADAMGEPRLLHARFDTQAARTPDRVAVIEGDTGFTFAALREESDRIAAVLRARGIGSGAVVGLHLERSAAYVAATIGILKAGAAVVPLPPAYPETRLREILTFGRLDAVIDGTGRLPRVGGTAVISPGDLADPGGAARDAGGDDPDAIAFVLCSSGSTGQPKMIARSHRSFFHRLEWTWNEWPFGADDVCVQKSHMTTTHSIYELFEPLLAGVTVHVVPDETVRDLEQFWDFLRERGATRLLIVPSMLQVSLDMPDLRLPPLRQVVLMGEYLRPQLAARAVAAFPPSTGLLSIYGSTEASSTLVCDLRAPRPEGSELPLGAPIAADVRPHVLGPDLEPVAAGKSGMLHMSGPALFSGYFRNPDLTAASFAQLPSGERVFNTQDQVRLAASGAIEYIGRVDHTVKVRGFRVDLGEVERAILGISGVTQAAVMLDGPASEQAALVAFHAPAIDRAGLMAQLRERLAPYMVPSVLVGMPALPLTASGKLDRIRLLEEYRVRPKAAADPRDLSATESRVVGIWSQVLRHEEAGADSNFFEVGGTSLSVFSAVNLLRKEFGLTREQLSEHSIYTHPTPRLLARQIDALVAGQAAAPAASAVAITLRQGNAGREPLFVIASSGGTLGAYEKLSKQLTMDRPIVGIRDPFVWGGREPASTFGEWISLYVGAILERQPKGPYFLCAFSSAGAFGYEIARRLQAAGHEVARLILIDPVGIAGELPGDFGHRTFRALFGGRRRKIGTRIAGWWRWVSGRGRREGERPGGNGFVMRHEEFARRQAAIRVDKASIKDLSSLFELNSGLPFALSDDDFAGKAPEEFVDVLLAKARSVAPDVDVGTIERILVQYYCLQIPATHFYGLRNYDGEIHLFEPQGPHVGLFAAYFRPHVRALRLQSLPIGEASSRVELACRNLSRSLRAHYRSMRDEDFVRGLVAAIDPLLR